MDKTRAARRSCHYDRAMGQKAAFRSTQDDYTRGTLIAGLIIAVSFGLMMLHWAVV